MSGKTWPVLAILAFLVGCGRGNAPRMALPSNSTEKAAIAEPDTVVNAAPSTKLRYQGRTPEEWGQALNNEDLDVARQAAQSLKVLRADGRVYLIKGLDSQFPETRRLCLETLSVSDLRTHGDKGRKILIKLAGDRMDLRIRELATQYLSEWDRTVPAP